MKKASGRLYLSGNEGISEAAPDGHVLHRAPLEGAGAICAGKEQLFCADAGGALWRLNRKTLLPEAVFGGGPGICDLCLSGDEARLYVLLAEADSVMMLDSKSGRPLLLNRCGCSPSQILLHGDLLVAAGGEKAAVLLYNADTLDCQKEIPMPGPVYSIAIAGGKLYALCLASQMDSLLIEVNRKGRAAMRLLGMPGGLLAQGDHLYAATQGWLHVFETQAFRLQQRNPVPGRFLHMGIIQGQMIAFDLLSEEAYVFNFRENWQKIAENVKSFCMGSTCFEVSALDL